MRIGTIAALTAVAACIRPSPPPAGSGAAQASAPSPVQSPSSAALRDSIAPRVDHHQHLVSPAGADWLYHRAMPHVDVPADVGSLLRERAARWNDSTALAGLYSETSTFFSSSAAGTSAASGRAEVASRASRVFGRPFRMTPFAYFERAGVGHVAGFLTRGEGRAARHFGHFYLELGRGSGEAPRITVESLTFPAPPGQPTIDGAQLVAKLDEAGIGRAVVLSDAYWFDSAADSATPRSYDEVRAENDWTAAQAGRFPDRLVAFCSFNPLREYALAELRRCASTLRMKGLKLHFGTSGVNLLDPAHVQRVRRVLEAANTLRMPIVLHVRGDAGYGRPHAEVLLTRLLPAAPDVPVQIAHLWGGGTLSSDALAVYAEAVAAGERSTRNLYFDVSDAAAVAGGSPQRLREIASRMRQIGLARILYGSDAVGLYHPAPREAWAEFRANLPLTAEELAAIADNVAPYLR